jgi:hypothetical protein
MKRAQPEAALHKAVAHYLPMVLAPEVVWTTVGHGGGGKVRGAQLKAMGLRAGWPDIQLMWRYGNATRVLCIELKSASGRLEPEQRACADDLERAGAIVLVARSLDAVKGILEGVNVPMKVTA